MIIWFWIHTFYFSICSHIFILQNVLFWKCNRLQCLFSTLIHLYIFIYISMYICLYIICISVCFHAIFMYVCVYVCMYVCVYFIICACFKLAIHEITTMWFFWIFLEIFHVKTIILILVLLFFLVWRGLARTQVPTITNYTVELSTFGIIAEVSRIWVQWNSLALEEAPRWSSLLPRQVSMLFHSIFLRTSS